MLAFFSWIVAILLSNGVDYEMAKLVSDDPFVVKDFIEDNFVKFVDKGRLGHFVTIEEKAS